MGSHAHGLCHEMQDSQIFDFIVRVIVIGLSGPMMHEHAHEFTDKY